MSMDISSSVALIPVMYGQLHTNVYDDSLQDWLATKWSPVSTWYNLLVI